ncbi:Fc receptor-like A isoform X7 [Arvicola amphibius]|uniref:Fc receptor-like A isoform X7 n=1 Tax=Arvicola amphibius TaxID=1047088 RepID=UPI0018E3CCE0|nr:Fc receptor-like A isoform X7 [Arvicola amphibius]
MKLSCVLGAWALYVCPAVLLATQMFPAGCHAELFPAPILKASPSNELHEGGSVTLSCQTKLSLQRSSSRLLFSFYKDGQTLSIEDISSELQINKASEEHSGSYWCQAATEDRQVWKQSSQLEIRVQGELMCMSPPILNPALQKPTASETPPTEPPGPPPPPPTPSAEHLRFSSSDPHFHHQMRLLLKQMQDVKVLLGHLVMELRDLTVYLKPGVTKAADK